MTDSNINNMMSSIIGNGVAFSNRYEVQFYLPSDFMGHEGSLDNIRNLELRAESVTIPGRSLSTTPYRFYGPARNFPYEQLYSGEISISFIVSANLSERHFFEGWLNFISNPNNYKFNYYDKYISKMAIVLLDRTNRMVFVSELEEVYPKSIGDISLGYDKNDEIIKQEVTFHFRKYTVQEGRAIQGVNDRGIIDPLRITKEPPPPPRVPLYPGGNLANTDFDDIATKYSKYLI